MRRLTNKNYKIFVGGALDELISLADINPNDVSKFPVLHLRKEEYKLGLLEDIEEELGIDLLTMFKVIKARTVWLKNDSREITEARIRDHFGKISCFELWLASCPECDFNLDCKDYGKTWALTKKELETIKEG